MFERLAFDGDAKYNAIEASSHLARYAVARPFCAGRRVLDIACGQGYGSYFMRRYWGATHVDGVDVASDAVAVARRMFSADGIAYHCHAAEGLADLFEPESFDLIVCLETIEHVSDAETLLRILQRHLRPGGALVVSCPNDYWYYPTPEQGNPFHTRKFRFGEFRGLAEHVLGPATTFLYGTPVSGFANLAIDDQRLRVDGTPDPTAIQQATTLQRYEMLPTDEQVDERNCSYFVGVWAGDQAAAVADCGVIFPCSMTASAPAAGYENITHLQAEVSSARTELFETRANLAWMSGRARQYEEQIGAARAEVEQQAAELRRQVAVLEAQLEDQTRAHEQALARRDEAADSDAHERRVLGLRAAGFQHENEFLKQELRTARYTIGQLEEEIRLVRDELARIREDQHRLAGESDIQRSLLEAQQALADARRDLVVERRAREEQTAEVADWARRIENMDRIKSFIPGWAKGGLKRMLRWK